MFTKNLLRSGWLHALFMAIVLYPIGTMTQKFVASYTGANILVYTFLLMLGSAISLLLISGPGELANKTLRRPETWLYALLQIFSYVLFLLSVTYVSATEGAALEMMGIIFTLILSFAFLGQKVNRYEILGAVVILYGFYLIIGGSSLPIEAKIILLFIIVVRGLVRACQKLITEIHKTNRKAVSFKAQLRVTGFVMAVASFVFLLFLLIMAYAKHSVDVKFLEPFPSFSDFINFQAFIMAAFLGVFVISIMKHCEFYAGKTISARYLTSLLSLQIVFVYGLEMFLAKFELIDPRALDSSVLPALFLVLLGNFIITSAGFIKDLKFIKQGQKQDTLANLEDNFIDNTKDFDIVKLNLSNLKNLYDGEMKKLSEDLGIDKIKLENILNYSLEDLKLEKKLAKKINSFASENVSSKDKLTKAYNRYHLEHVVEDLLTQEQHFNLYYLDLNKFKPVNDNYGHEAGDFVLIETVNRLASITEFREKVFRLGGDEFVLIQTENTDNDLSDIILKTVEEAIDYNSASLEISTAIGKAFSSEHNSLDEMLSSADKLMYKDKTDR